MKDVLIIVCTGALLGIGMRFGDWIYKNLCEILQDLKQRRKD